MPGATIALAAGNDQVKEAITLAGPTSPATFSYTLSLAGVSAQPTSAGGIDFRDGSGHTAFTFVPPFLQEGDTAQTVSHNVSLTLGPSAGSVTLAVDPTWLASPQRHFPVTIDPTTSFTGTSQDCYLFGPVWGTNHYCGQSNIAVGWDGTQAGHGLLQFNVQSAIPSNVQVLNAELGLYLQTDANANTTPISA